MYLCQIDKERLACFSCWIVLLMDLNKVHYSYMLIRLFYLAVCDPKCPKGIPCNVKTRVCECPDLKYVDDNCRTSKYLLLSLDNAKQSNLTGRTGLPAVK